MAWNIFRKDLLLLWPAMLLSSLAQFALDAMMFLADQSPEPQYLLLAVRLFVIVVFLAIALTISLAVHQDAIPGTTQDWLVRPIRRRDLLVGKFLFILAVVHLPMFLGDFGEALAHGFPWQSAVVAALTRNLYVLVTLSLPALGIAAMTRNTAQFVGMGVAYCVVFAGASFLLSNIARINGQGEATNPLYWTGVAWVQQGVSHVALVMGAVIALLLLYFRRKIALARTIFVVFASLTALYTFLPWSWIFAVQEAIAAPSHRPAVAMTVDAGAPHYAVHPGEDLNDYSAGAAEVELRGRAAGDITVEDKARRTQGDVTVFIPLEVRGLPPRALLWPDRALVTLRSQAGQVLFQGYGEELKLPQSQTAVTFAYEEVRIPALAFGEMKDRPLNLELHYSLTLLQARPPITAPALGTDLRSPEMGRCTSGVDSDGNNIALHCLQTSASPSCLSATLADPATGQRNPETLICAPDYAPYAARLFPDAIGRYQIEVPFRDSLGLAKYPVGGELLHRAQVILSAYEAVRHFELRIEAAGIHLSRWTANSSWSRNANINHADSE